MSNVTSTLRNNYVLVGEKDGKVCMVHVHVCAQKRACTHREPMTGKKWCQVASESLYVQENDQFKGQTPYYI